MSTNPQALMLACALRYAQRYNWPVFPVHAPIFDGAGNCAGCTCEHYRRTEQCKRNHPRLYLGPDGKCDGPGKCPAVRWAERATLDPAQITAWWGRAWQTTNVDTRQRIAFTPNIGIACGPAGLLVFDVDSYKEFCGDLGDLLAWDDRQTVTSLTGGGGEHLLYDRAGKPYGNSTRGLPPGVDIRGDGGYIVAPPSMHRAGGRYQFEEGYGPRDVALLPIPPRLDAILSTATPQRRQGGDVCITTPALLRRSVGLVERILQRADIDHTGQMSYGDGFRWVMRDCPFMPTDDPHGDDGGAFVIVLGDGRIAAGCHHNRCQKRIEAAEVSGWTFLRQLAGDTRRRVMVEVAL
jgi:hypothetical protein